MVDLEKAGFVNRGGKGSHRNFKHSKTKIGVTLSDAEHYQERLVKQAIKKAKR